MKVLKNLSKISCSFLLLKALFFGAFFCSTVEHKPTGKSVDVSPVIKILKDDPDKIPDKYLRDFVTDKLTECSTALKDQGAYIRQLEDALAECRKKNEEKDKIIAKKSEGAGQAFGMKFQWYGVIGIIILGLIGFFLWIMRNGLPGLFIPKN